MEVLSFIQDLFAKYGYSVLFFGLLLEFIALPFPGETTMAFAGFLSYTGRLDFITLIIVAFTGTTVGMTITYFIGLKAGMPFIQRYGKWILFSPSKLEKTQRWFERYGSILIFIGYFIPGVRHFTGYFAGIIALPSVNLLCMRTAGHYSGSYYSLASDEYSARNGWGSSIYSSYIP